jgi:hypothetical protein
MPSQLGTFYLAGNRNFLLGSDMLLYFDLVAMVGRKWRSDGPGSWQNGGAAVFAGKIEESLIESYKGGVTGFRKRQEVAVPDCL